MYKIVFCLKRRQDITLEEFSSYWRDRHADLFEQYAQLLRVVRYTQSHRLDHPLNAALRAGRTAPEAFDGVAQVWFRELDDLIEGVSSPEGRAAGQALIEDEREFIDHAASPIWLAQEFDISVTPAGRADQ